jgi:protein involved in polysaccharide export with SLBB domain
MAATLLAAGQHAAQAQSQLSDERPAAGSETGAGGVPRLRQTLPPPPRPERDRERERERQREGEPIEPALEDRRQTDDRAPGQRLQTDPVYVPGEFERFVQRLSGSTTPLRRFGADLMTTAEGRDVELSPLVPADYVVAPGDEVLLTLWGSVDADLRLQVDRSGRITIPRVGAVQVAGLRYADLQPAVARRVGQVFRNFELSVVLGQLRGIRVFVTGFVVKPGAYTVTSLSTVLGALMRAGGPAAAGSFRAVQLRRGNRLLASFDLYDLMLGGDRSADQIVQAGDVIHVGPVGPQVGVIGSVNKPTILELKPGETVSDALRVAGGFSAVADRSRLSVERLRDRNAERIAQLDLPAALTQPLSQGDVLRAFSAVDIALPTQRQSKRVRIEGEVQRPAEYVLPEGSSVNDALRAAGGITAAAYVFATEFNRISVQQTQQQNYERALRDLETGLATSSTSQRVTSGDEATALAARNASRTQLIDRLRTLRPTGRVVLQLEPTGRELPDLALEDGDRIFIPARPTTVGVFGSVFNAGTYLHLDNRRLGDYLRLAGGPTKEADEASVFMVRANGSVISGRQRQGGWFSRGNTLTDVAAEPGDTIFVPTEFDRTTFTQNLRDWTQILSQFALGAAALKVLGN